MEEAVLVADDRRWDTMEARRVESSVDDARWSSDMIPTAQICQRCQNSLLCTSLHPTSASIHELIEVDSTEVDRSGKRRYTAGVKSQAELCNLAVPVRACISESARLRDQEDYINRKVRM